MIRARDASRDKIWPVNFYTYNVYTILLRSLFYVGKKKRWKKKKYLIRIISLVE